MKVLVTGRGTSGSWQVRGKQLGEAIGADVLANAHSSAGFDAVVLVKRPCALEQLRGVPLVWDVVDAYPQPLGNGWDRSTCVQWLRDQVHTIRPTAIVAATGAMALDCAEFGLPVLTLPHHAWPGKPVNAVAPKVLTVGYQGGEAYLGRWRQILERECARRGWRFVLNPVALADVDIAVALRDASGYAPANWKSNVKLANAQGSGTPCVLNREAGYKETACGAERWADTDAELATALDALTPYAARLEASRGLLDAAPRLESVATRYRAWLEHLHA